MTLFTVLFCLSLLIIFVSESKNFTLSLGTFILISLLLVGATGVYSWLTKVNHVDSLTYIHNLDWSDDYSFSDITPNCYATAVDAEQNLHIVWGAYGGPRRVMYLKHLVTNPQGELVIPPQILTENGQIQQISVAFASDRLHIFWVGEDEGDSSDDRLNLFHTQLDPTGQISQQTVAGSGLFSYDVTDLQVATGDQAFLLAWIDQIDTQIQLRSLSIPYSDRQMPEPQTLVSSKRSLSHLNLTHDSQGQFHLLWQDQGATKVTQLYYQRLNPQGGQYEQPLLVDQGEIRSNTLTTTSQEVVMAWEKPLENGNNPGVVFGANFSLKELPTHLQIHQLTKDHNFSFTPALAATSEDEIYFTYGMRKPTGTSLAYQKYTGDFAPELDGDQWLMTKQFEPTQQHLIRGPQNDIHLYWFEIYHPTELQYANNFNISEVTPLEMIGLPTRNLKKSLIENGSFVFFPMVFDFTIYLILFFNIVTFGVTAIIIGRLSLYLSRKKGFKLLEHNLYSVTTLLCLIQIGTGRLSLDFLKNEMLLHQLTEHFWFIIITSLIANLLYIKLTRLGQHEFMFGAFVGIAWLYWVVIMVEVLNLPFLNYVLLPNI